MSSKKEKFLESAQKFIVKGQLDRAIRDYEQVVALDPNDIRHRQRLAELLVRSSRNLEAIGEYDSIGKFYADNGFYLKAIAVYKQIQKLDPDDMKTCLNLAVLNEKQGLTGNALAEYGRVYSYYEKNGKPTDALKILENMLSIDPDNLNTRLKFAENRHKMGMKDQAYEDFCEIAVLLKKRGDESAFRQICDRIRFLFSDRKDVALEILHALINNEGADSAIKDLQEIVKEDQNNLGAWNLLLEACHAAGMKDDAKQAIQKMARIFPGDLSIKERLMQIAVDEGDLEGGRNLLTSNSAVFVEKGSTETLERLYQGFLGLAPHDVSLLQGLKKLYETVGNQTGVAETSERLDSLSSLGTEPTVRPPVKEVTPPEETSMSDENVQMPLTEMDGEIPLSLAGDDTDGMEDDEAAPEIEPARVDMTEPELTAAPEVEEGSTEVEFESHGEIDLELEISENELADLAGLYEEHVQEQEPLEEHVQPLEELDQVPQEPLDELDLDIQVPLEELDQAPQEPLDELELDVQVPLDELELDVQVPLDELELDVQVPLDELELDVQVPLEELDLAGQAFIEEHVQEVQPPLVGADEFVEMPVPPDGLTVAQDTPVGGLFTEDELESVELDVDFPEMAEAAPVQASGQDKYGTDGQFSAFKKGLAQQLDQGDTETRYNLGIAFMEMGLYDEAIAEFAAASVDPRRRIDCISLQGVCFRDKGDYGSAEEIFKKGIGLAELSVEETLSIKYELALLYESTGRKEDALQIYRQICADKRDFRDTLKKIANLQGSDEVYDVDLVELESEEID